MNRRKFMGMVGAAAVTPALTSAKTDEPKLFALLHDGHFSGDSTFYFPDYAAPYKAGMSMDEIKTAHLEAVKKRDTEWRYSASELKEDLDYWQEVFKDVVGALIVDERAINAMKAIWESDPGSDSATYCCNRAAKRVAWELKIFTIGRGMEGK